MITYVVEQLDTVTLTGGPLTSTMDLMSPFVWREKDAYRIMVRGVPNPLGPTDPTGLIVGGSGSDGLSFAMDDQLALVPGPGPDDAGGCEDPTVFVKADGSYLVYYTGVDAAHQQGSMIFVAARRLSRFRKRS